jgi:DNA-binding beta-propeller fold protein YncE
VIEGALCNAGTQKDCQRPWHRVPVGNIALDLALDPSQHTVYVVNAPDRTLSLIDTRKPCGSPVRCLH